MNLNLKTERDLSFPEYSNITEAELKQIKNDLIQLTETDNKLTIFQRIGFILDQFTKLLKGSYEFRFKEFNYLNKELNTMYNKVVDVIEHNKEARYKMKNDKVNMNIYIAVLCDTMSDDDYELSFATQWYDPIAIKKYANSVITIANRYPNPKDQEAILTSNLKNFKSSIDKYSAWMDRYVPGVVKYEYTNVDIERAIDISKRNLEIFYAAYVYGSKNNLQTDLIYIQLMKKMYESMKTNTITDNPKIIQFINDIFGYILQAMDKGIEHDNRIFEMSQKCFKGYYINISEIYEYITTA